jgi:hypothetical protein
MRSRSAAVVSTVIGLCCPSPTIAQVRLSDNQTLMTHDSSAEAIRYVTADLDVLVTRDDGGEERLPAYVIDYTVNGGRKASHRFEAGPRPDVFEIQSIERSKALCDRDMVIVTLREYTDIEAPSYSYMLYFIELSEPGKASEYFDATAHEIGGPVFAEILADTASVDCSEMPVSVEAK